MARAPRPGQVRRELEPLLGRERCQALQATLITQAVHWGLEVGAGSVHLAFDPGDAAAELRELVGPRVGLFAQSGTGRADRLARACERVFARSSAPLLVVWPELPVLRQEHARAALDDLRSGCDLVLGPGADGGFYLLGLARPLPPLFDLRKDVWRDADAMRLGLQAVQEAGLELGLLRVERGLRRPADVAAALADPLLRADLRLILRR